MPLPSSFVLVDLETTGANPVQDRITEIAIIRVEDGCIVRRWQTLVNPGRPIPALIQRLIGITDEMVAAAPAFADLADEVRGLLDGVVFIAHNARFDYGFLCNEYARLEQSFEAPVLCTVKLSRALYPEYHRHGLDALIERHAFVCDARHRAMGDADVLWQFIRQVEANFDDDALARACQRAMKQPPRPPALPEGALEGLPDAPGVYQLFGEEDALLSMGCASSLRAHIMALMATQGGRNKAARLIKQINRIEWQETAGELDAMLRELKLSRETPSDATAGRGGVFGLRLMPGRKRAPIFEQVALDGRDPVEWQDLFGVFRARKEADSMLRELAAMYRLCPRRLGLESGDKGACGAYRQKRCAGACVSKETPEEHDRRLLGALASIRLKPWPWQGPMLIHERSDNGVHEAFHVFDRWCHLGSVNDDAALRALTAALPPRRFDAGIYRLLQRWLGNSANLTLAQPLERV